ncbi:DUF6455 family protein [Rhodobacter sp. Har01]|uniref:DUF6455 family protein n=1 Tax=Rhodobacter sp. Har01 TaxID=2883999 RepID=UPI001D0984A1|nr:DUF6455 family protein [Rhodobacter sp. Har01]MCB6178335.1 DUF6455 family protein [Rhodobacter sp. Har01]
MIGYTDAPRAWWLTRGMARVAGVNLPQAVVDGWLTRDELAEIVARCEGCQNPSRCNAWLAGSGSARRMPDFCPNKPTIESLCTH